MSVVKLTLLKHYMPNFRDPGLEPDDDERYAYTEAVFDDSGIYGRTKNVERFLRTRSEEDKAGSVFPEPVPAMSTVSSPRRTASATSSCQQAPVAHESSRFCEVVLPAFASFVSGFLE